MSVFDYLSEMYNSDEISEQSEEVQGDAKALVDGMIENAPNQKEQIKYILRYAANSDPDYNIWDDALQYYETVADNIGDTEKEMDTPEDEEPVGDGVEEISDEEIPTDEEPAEGGDEDETILKP